MQSLKLFSGLLLLLAVITEVVQPLCVLESDFGFKINCAFKKAGLFRVRNLGGIKAHASLGFSLGDELGFDQSLTNQDPSRRRSVSFKNGAPNVLVDTPNRSGTKQEKRAKQNRIMMRPMPTVGRPNPAAMDKLSSLHRVSTIPGPGPTIETKFKPAITMAKPMPMGVPPFKPLPPKEETLKVLPLASQPIGYPSEKSSDNVSRMVSHMTASYHKPSLSPFVPMPSQAISIITAPTLKNPNNPNSIKFLDSVPHRVHDLAVYGNTKKNDDYNSISGYSDDVTLQLNKEDINAKIAEIAKAGNISMEAVEAAIMLRQQQLLSKYANIPMPTTTTTTTTTTETVLQLEPEPEIIVAPVPQKPKRNPTQGKVMNAPREYYPVGYEKNFDDHFQSKVDLPDTTFHCGDQKYFPGLYGDQSLGCMVFHVCALTDDGLVMKSFLCPESTLFDQTILKCNWWFYVDCASSPSLYDTNIPVSKSYQLMKALTFFSSYKKAEEGQQSNPEDVDGIKEAITILENQDTKPAANDNVEIITSLPIIDERHNNNNINNNKNNDYPNVAPVYRGTRQFNNATERNRHKSNKNNDNFKLIQVNADINFNNTKDENKSDERKRRRLISRNNYPTTKPTTTTISTTSSTTTVEATTEAKPIIELLKQEMKPIEDVKQEKLTDQIENIDQMDPTILKEAENSPPVKRFYRSSAETRNDKEIKIINNEKVHIVRPIAQSSNILEVPEIFDTLRPYSSRFKKEAITIVVPTKYSRDRS